MIRLILAIFVTTGLVVLSRYMYVLPIHVITFFVTIFAVVIADLHAAMWVFGKIKLLPKWRMEKLHQIVSLGLLIIITSGLIMFWPVRDYLLYESAFQIKLLFVAALLVNSLMISRHMGVASAREFSELSWGERWPLLLSGLVSTLCWLGAFTAAQFLGL